MKKTFRTNLGSVEAKEHGLDHTKCVAGATVDMPEETAKALAKAHPAIFVEPDEEAAVKGVAKPAEITAPEKPGKH